MLSIGDAMHEGEEGMKILGICSICGKPVYENEIPHKHSPNKIEHYRCWCNSSLKIFVDRLKRCKKNKKISRGGLCLFKNH